MGQVLEKGRWSNDYVGRMTPWNIVYWYDKYSIKKNINKYINKYIILYRTKTSPYYYFWKGGQGGQIFISNWNFNENENLFTSFRFNIIYLRFFINKNFWRWTNFRVDIFWFSLNGLFYTTFIINSLWKKFILYKIFNNVFTFYYLVIIKIFSLLPWHYSWYPAPWQLVYIFLNLDFRFKNVIFYHKK